MDTPWIFIQLPIDKQLVAPESPALQVGSLPPELPGKPVIIKIKLLLINKSFLIKTCIQKSVLRCLFSGIPS